MDEIVNQVAERTGLPEEMARLAVETVLGVIKERLPQPLAHHVEALLQGGSMPDDLGDLGRGLGGLLGKF